MSDSVTFEVGEGANKVTVIVIDSEKGVDVETVEVDKSSVPADDEREGGPFDKLTIHAGGDIIDIKDSSGVSLYRSDSDEDDDEEETCGFCKFMKGGACKEVFKEWEKCVDQGRSEESDFVEACIEKTQELKICMEGNRDYYGPLLEAEKEEMARQQEDGS